MKWPTTRDRSKMESEEDEGGEMGWMGAEHREMEVCINPRCAEMRQEIKFRAGSPQQTHKMS